MMGGFTSFIALKINLGKNYGIIMIMGTKNTIGYKLILIHDL